VILAISYSLTGFHAGMKVVHRKVEGPQLWTVKMDVVDQDGTRHESEAAVKEAIHLQAIGHKATEMMDEYLSEFGNVVRTAKWEAYYRPDPSQRKKPKRGRA
jgi:hypothetical protein